jgi:arylsulfatase A-like enzyme
MDALQWMQAHRDEPTFLWLHYFDPHLPYEPPRDFVPEGNPPSGMSRRFAVPVVEARSGLFIPDREQRQWIRGLYDGESRYTDRSIGRLIEELKRLGMYDDTLIVLTADHGEELWEHDSFEHGHSLYDELLHVPLIVRPPGGGGGRRVATPVSTVGLVPTMLELCGLPWKPEDFSSPPLLGAAADKAGPQPLFAGGLLSLENRSCVVWEDLKLIRRAVTGREELFDLARDPAELHSLPPESSERTPELRKLLEEHLRESAALRTRLGILDPAKMVLDDATLRDLRNLGYVK